jgi:CheY-like chemotaxis protein
VILPDPGLCLLPRQCTGCADLRFSPRLGISLSALDFKKAKTIPILAMSANVFQEDIDRGMAAGMNGHIGKPIDFNTVLATLREYLKPR